MTARAPQPRPELGTAPGVQESGADPHAVLERLARAPAGGDEQARLRAEAIEAWLPLARQLARRYAGRGEPLDDLTQTATVGLIKAIDRFEPDRGSDFVAFAAPTVAGEIRRHFRDRTWQLRVPRRLQELRLAIRDSADGLAQRLGHTPSTGELAADLRVSPDEIVEGRQVGQAYAPLSLDADVSPAAGTATGGKLGDLVGEEDADLAYVELRMALAPALDRLPDREKRILCLRFYANLTQAEIAARVGISQMHVSRLLSRSLRLLREVITDDRPSRPE
ncbi:MAG: SigB/SigF/SigG family RNA polymerase sigma factor [Natronosporangium sp.]